MKKRTLIIRTATIVAVICLLSATTVSAASNRLVTSQGRYEINDGKGSVVIDSDDIEDNAQAIAALQGQLGGLNFKFATEKEVNGSGDDSKGYYWSQDSNGDWVKIGAVGSAVPTDVLSGKKFSSEYGVDVEGEMPVPTSAEVGSRTNPSSNLSTSGSSVNISNSSNTTEDHTNNTSQIELGIGQKITIPHGYYNKDIVVANGITNKGSLNWNPSSSTSQSVQAGYYTGGNLNSSNAYNAGANAVSIPTPFYWKPALQDGPGRFDSSATTTYTVPKTGKYNIYGFVSSHADDTHSTNVHASAYLNGSSIFNAANGLTGDRRDGRSVYAADSKVGVSLSAGQKIKLEIFASGFGVIRGDSGGIIVIVYTGQ